MKKQDNKSEANLYPKTRYLEILLQQYSECWADIRNYINALWQIPTILIPVITFLGFLYGHYMREIQVGRIAVLLLAFGFALVSLIALIKHRFFSDRRVEDFENIQEQIKELLKQDEFQEFKDSFREIKWKTRDLIRDGHCIHRTKAYLWQLGLVISIFIGIVALLLAEYVIFLLSLP